MKLNGAKMTMLTDDVMESVVGGIAKGAEWKLQGMTFYIVARGDRLDDIAFKYHTTVDAIKALNPVLLNNINGINIKAGQELRVL